MTRPVIGKPVRGLALRGSGIFSSQGSGGTPPVLPCSALTLSVIAAFPPTTVDNLFVGNTFTSTRNGASSNPPAGEDSVNLFNLTGAAGPLAFEIDGAAPSVLNDTGLIGGGCFATDFSAFAGVMLQLGTGVNGQVIDPFTLTPITAANLTYPATFPVTFHGEIDEAGTMYWRFEDGSGTLIATGNQPSGGSFTGKTCKLFMVGEAPLTNGSTFANTFVPDISNFKMPLNNPAAVSWCSLPAGAPAVPVEKFLQTSADPNVSLINSDRTVRIVSDGVNAGSLFMSVGWSPVDIPASVKNMDGNVFEFEINDNPPDPLVDAINLFFQVFVGGNTSFAIVTQSFGPTFLMALGGEIQSRITLADGDLFSFQFLDNGASPTEIIFRFVPAVGTPLTMSSFNIVAAEDLSVLLQNLGSSEPAGSTLDITFNATEPQMSFTYPDGAKDYEGTPLVTTSGPFVEPPLTWYELGYISEDPADGDTLVVSGGGKIVTATSNGLSGIIGTARVFMPKGVVDDGNVYATTVKITTADTSEEAAEVGIYGIGGPSNNDVKGELKRNNSGNIIYEVNTTETTLVSSTPIEVDDYLTAVVDINNENFRFYFWDDSAGTLHDSGWVSFTVVGETKTTFFQFAGADGLQSGESLVLASQAQAADMDQANTISALNGLSARDFNGVVIS